MNVPNDIVAAITVYTAAANNFHMDSGTRHDEDLPSYGQYIGARDGLLLMIELYGVEQRLSEHRDLLKVTGEALDVHTEPLEAGMEFMRRVNQFQNVRLTSLHAELAKHKGENK